MLKRIEVDELCYTKNKDSFGILETFLTMLKRFFSFSLSFSIDMIF